MEDWLSKGKTKSRRRLYKTGDLVRYNHDGSLIFHGRIRGQRIELGEIEHSLVRCLAMKFNKFESAVEMISPSDDPGSAWLAAFFATSESSPEADSVHYESKFDGRQLKDLHAYMTTYLTQILPSYMVPSYLIPLRILPRTPSKKLDRMHLRLVGSRKSRVDLELSTSTKKEKGFPVTTETEKKLQTLWS